MQKTVEKLNPTKRRFTVEIPAEEIEGRITEALMNLRRTVKIPGFRPGKAPLSLLDRRFGKEVETEVLEKVIPEYYAKILDEEKLVPVAPPVFEDYNYKRNSPLKMTFTVEIRPEVEEIKYEGFVVEDEKIEVSDEDIKRGLERLQIEKSTYEDVDRESQEGDFVIIDYKILEEEKDLEGQIVKIGSELVPAELSEALKSKKKGEEFETKVTFPEDFPNKNLAGKTLTLKGKVKEIKVMKKPEINDQLAKDLGYENLEKLKEALKEAIEKTRRQMLEDRQKEEILKQLLDENDIEVPESLLQEELNLLVSEEKQSNPDADEEKLKEELKERAIRNVKVSLLLDIIAEKENVSVTEEEIKNRIMRLSAEMYVTPEVFMQMYLPDQAAFYKFRQAMIREKTIQMLLEKAEKKEKKEEIQQQEDKDE